MWMPGKTLDNVEKEVVEQALRFFHYNKTHTAEALGITPKTLYNKIERYNIDAKAKEGEHGYVKDETSKSEGLQAEAGPRVGALPNGQKRALPVRESEEVQEMPSKFNAPDDTNKYSKTKLLRR